MIIRSENITLYPYFSNFILSELPKVIHRPKVWNALLTASGLRTEGKEGWGNLAIGRLPEVGELGLRLAWFPAYLGLTARVPPIITPVRLPEKIIDGEPKNDEDGRFDPASPYEINVNTYWVDQFEVDAKKNNPEQMKRARHSALVFVLHEFVHYLDWHYAESGFSDNDRSNDDDNGFRFEKAAFGKKATKWWKSSLHKHGDDGSSSFFGLRLPEW